ncbi:MAG: hypothetical protein H7175_14660 [Burkholderiales bacterium]|nr:hypothetical protein [Anaerolineae bacterium]
MRRREGKVVFILVAMLLASLAINPLLVFAQEGTEEATQEVPAETTAEATVDQPAPT